MSSQHNQIKVKEGVRRKMSQQAAAGQGAGSGGGVRKGRYFPRGGGIKIVKPHKSAISEILQGTFNTGHNKFAAQFLQSRKKAVANYLQRSSAAEEYLVAETVCTGKKQVIELPAAVDENAPDMADLVVIRTKEVKLVAKQRQKLEELLKKGFAAVYKQCLQDIKEKLELMEDWEATLKNQLLHNLIQKIKRICVGFDDHKQEVFNLVQTLRALLLYTQSNKEMVEEYGHNLKSFWDMVEAFRGTPGLH
jgi:hypothetical protein